MPELERLAGQAIRFVGWLIGALVVLYVFGCIVGLAEAHLPGAASVVAQLGAAIDWLVAGALAILETLKHLLLWFIDLLISAFQHGRYLFR